MQLRLLLLFFVFALPAVAQTEKKEMVLQIGDIGSPATWEPVTATRPVEYHLCQFLFDSIVVPRQEGDFVLSLAKEIDISPDGLSYTFILHKDILWSDGTPLTSKDVEFTLALLLNKETDNYDGTLAKYIEDVTCIHPQAIIITLAKPFYSPLALFTFKILPKHKFALPLLQRAHAFTQEPVGCGPFLLASKKQQEAVLQRSPLFNYRSKPQLDKIVMYFYPSKEKAVEDLLCRKIQVVTQVAPKNIAELERQGEQFVLNRYRPATIDFVAFNHRVEHRYHHLFSDYRFRRALLQSLDRQAILQKKFSAERQTQAHAVISGPFPASSWAYNDKLKPFPYNFAYAEQLLKEVLSRKGYQKDEAALWSKENEGRITLLLKCAAGDSEVEAACRQMVASWQRLGISVSLETPDAAAWQREIWEEHNFDLCYTQYACNNTLDIFPLFDPARTGKGQSNFSGYIDSKLVELFYQLQSTLNPWMLRSLCHNIHQTVYDDTVHLFLWQLDLYAAHHRSIKNLKLHPQYLFNFPERWKIVDK